ncbi:MAG TPA: MFS transporter [Candidatus Deferrimicrobiaceae bacterium]|nr:MFS transporter [Candidatus Deferrimicrobiaceae bacterium]
MTPARLVACVCAAQVCAQIGAYTWPALLPDFLAEWRITNREAGWITGIFYAAYTVSVPILVTLTDRVDARAVYLSGVALTVASHLGFAVLADGPWGAAAARALAGVGWAGTYMTGLKLLADRVEPALMSRAVAGHAASIGIAGAVSFVFAGTLGRWLGWRGAFAAAGVAAMIGWLIVFRWAPARERRPAAAVSGALFDFRPVLRNRSAMAYAVAYCAHTWEMNALRGWAVAFLAYVAATTGDRSAWIGPTAVAMTMGLVGTWASVAGNEAAIRLGRPRLVRLAMTACVVCAAAVGFVGARSYPLAAGLVLLYGLLIWLDSSSLTAGAAGSADPARRGATLALHSMAGYAGGSVGPIVIGWILDLSGGMSPMGWGLAFLHVAGIALLGQVAFVLLGPRDLVGDRRSGAGPRTDRA